MTIIDLPGREPAGVAPEARRPPIKVGILVASVSRDGGGVAECLRGLTQHLHHPPGTEVEVFGLVDRHTQDDLPSWAPVPVRVAPTQGPPAFGYSAQLGGLLRDSGIDLLHVHGLWMYVSLAARRWGRARRRPYMISPHGHLDAWALANRRWKKQAARLLYEQRNLQEAAVIHALCQAEADAVRAMGLANPVCIIPNGINLPGKPHAAAPSWRDRLPASARILLFLGRLTPQKGLAALLRAWSIVQGRSQQSCRDWHLVIAGWDQGGHADELKEIAATLSLERTVLFVGPQHGDEKEATLAAADAFVLPSVSEGLPMAVLEAWARALPVIMTPRCNLPEGYAAGAALQALPTSQDLARALEILIAMPESRRREMGLNGLDLVRRRFTWPTVSGQMEEVYRWMLGQQEQPPTVRTV